VASAKTTLLIISFGRVARDERLVDHKNRGEDITGPRLAKVERDGGCPGFGVGTWVLGWLFPC
jgi:hypothetical protein